MEGKTMETIASFTVDHMRLLPGVYVSRRDCTGQDIVTTFDIRMTRPNYEPVMNTAEIHTLEHLGATFLRNHEIWGNKVIYFGPMGCRTGFYLILSGDHTAEEIVPLLREMYEFMSRYEGDVPGASAKECGNYLDLNLPMAKYVAGKYLDEVLTGLTPDRLKYS
jgi:LuxS protein involved in autoinducer AI2 synthesis